MMVNHRPTVSNTVNINSFAFGVVRAPSGYTLELDEGALVSAAAPSYVHSMDAFLLRNALHDWKHPVFTIHDAVQVLPTHLPKVRSALSQSYIETVKANSLDKFGNECGVSAELLPRPEQGTADISEVRNATDLFT
jgi:hypothetical protein